MMFQLKNKKKKEKEGGENLLEYIAGKMFTLSLTNFIVIVL